MMTNSEIIDVLDDITWNGCGRYEKEVMIECRSTAISSLEENDKLKAEIEQLKSELEQSVRLPCKVGDNIYFRVKGRNQFAEYVDFIQTQKITRIYIDEDGTLYCSATEKFIECDINKTIFLTREEAERHLKGKVEE